MSYTSTITSKGTITIPSEIRKKLGLKQGMRVIITQDSTERIELKRLPTIEEVHAINQAHLKKIGMWPLKPYKSGDGFTAHVKEKYGSNGQA